MVDIVVPAILCAAFFRADIVWVFVYSAMIVLRMFNLTEVIPHDGLPVLYVVTFLYILQIYASFRTRGYRPYPLTVTVAGVCMGLFRLPVNFIFSRELLLQLGRWHVLPAWTTPAAYRSSLMKVADSAEILMLVTIFLSVILLVLHFTLPHRRRPLR